MAETRSIYKKYKIAENKIAVRCLVKVRRTATLFAYILLKLIQAVSAEGIQVFLHIEIRILAIFVF